MKNRITTALIFLAAFVLMSGNNISSNKNDRERMNLSGKVKSLAIFEYQASGKIDHVKKGELKSGNADAYNYSQFDTLGKLTLEKSLAKENIPFRLKVYKYNSKDSVIEISIFNPDSELVQKTTYKRDKKGRALEIRFLNDKGKTEKSLTQTFDDKKLTMERIERDENDSVNKYVSIPKEIYFYDGKGNVKEVHHYTYKNPTTMIYAMKSTYSYDTNNRLIESIHYFKNDSVRERTSYIYSANGKMESVNEAEFLYSRDLKQKTDSKFDEKGSISEKTVFINEENKTDKWTYKYETDSIGNWIRQTEFLNSNAVKIAERKIEYYP